ncbi:MAG TPA: family 20 glycosylhydrolase [Lacipirellulaceae bacterium]|nr:family 20 glycosylhydrolase [Lacipirellulaceae bacterium]
MWPQSWGSAASFVFACAVSLLAALGFVRHAARGATEKVSYFIEWKLIENDAKGGYDAELTLHNGGPAPLAGKWALFFNDSAKLLPDSVGDGVTLTHLNGDFYVLEPSESAKPIDSDASITTRVRGEPWAINISDAPSGFYLMRGGREGAPSEAIPMPVHVGPFPAADKMHRGASDRVPVVTAESRFLENQSLTKLPLAEVAKITPTPLEFEPLPGRFRIADGTPIVYEAGLEVEAKSLENALRSEMTGTPKLKVRTKDEPSNDGAIQLRIGDSFAGRSTKSKVREAYELTVIPDKGIEIVGNDAAGVFYGVQTLRAMIPIGVYEQPTKSVDIEAAHISDAPRFSYRGMHLDVARNFHTKASVEKLVDVMAFYKLNRLHLHLTDDEGWRIEIKQLPELTEFGGRRGHTLNEANWLQPALGSGPMPESNASSGSGFYSQDEFVELLQYAAARQVAVIPEIDFPGHARAAIKSMQARERRLSSSDVTAAAQYMLTEPGDTSEYESVQMWRDNVVDVGRDETYRFLDIVFGEMSAMYERAGVKLESVHLGGDEVPDGVWEKSSACRELELPGDSKLARRSRLELYFMNRASQLLAKRSIQPACWEDCLLLEAANDSAATEKRRAANKPTPTAYVWNNVWGWGREDAAYRLANAGFDVVLCNATNLYFDLACEKDPLERGYYWAGFVGMRAPFEFVPLDVFKNANQTSMGQAEGEESFADRVRLTASGANHILGIQGELWSENLRSEENLEYMAYPRMIALAERGWAKSPQWASIRDAAPRRAELETAWNRFANRLGQRELPRLDYFAGGMKYRLPPPGAVVRKARLEANVELPGLDIRYTTDGSEPELTSTLYSESVPIHGAAKLRTFDTRGRGSRTVTVSATKGE